VWPDLARVRQWRHSGNGAAHIIEPVEIKKFSFTKDLRLI
jgi:hypothetical protein